MWPSLANVIQSISYLYCNFFPAFFVMVILACILNFQRALGLLIITLLAVFFFFWDWLMEHYGSWMWEASSPIRCLLSRNWIWIRWWGMSTNTEASSEPIQKGSGTICKQLDGSNFRQNVLKLELLYLSRQLQQDLSGVFSVRLGKQVMMLWTLTRQRAQIFLVSALALQLY